jgi:hypothetical protein
MRADQSVFVEKRVKAKIVIKTKSRPVGAGSKIKTVQNQVTRQVVQARLQAMRDHLTLPLAGGGRWFDTRLLRVGGRGSAALCGLLALGTEFLALLAV